MPIYNKFKTSVLSGGYNLATDTIKVALLTSAYTPDIDTHDFFDHVSASEITGAGYTAGGATITSPTVTQDSAGDKGVYDAADVTWSTSTITARYAVMYKSTGTAATSPLIQYIDFGADKSSAGENFTISWNVLGIISVA